MRFGTFLWDLDGTVVDSLADIADAVNAARAKLGFGPLARDLVRSCVGDGMGILIRRVLPEAPDRFDEALAACRAHYEAHCLDHTDAYPGMRELLADLHAAGARMALTTNKPEAFTRRIVEQLDLARFFGVVIGGDTLAQRKPDPEVFRHALRVLNADAAGALVVGDGRPDAEGARAAGLPFCGVLWGMSDPAQVRAWKPDFTAASPAELRKLLLNA